MLAEVGYRGYRPPTMLYILCSMASAQQTNFLPENASQNDAIFPKSQNGIYQTTSQCLSSYGCAIIVLYISINVQKLTVVMCIGLSPGFT